MAAVESLRIPGRIGRRAASPRVDRTGRRALRVVFVLVIIVTVGVSGLSGFRGGGSHVEAGVAPNSAIARSPSVVLASESIHAGAAPAALLAAAQRAAVVASAPGGDLVTLVEDAADGYVLALSPNASLPGIAGCLAWKFGSSGWAALPAPPSNLTCGGGEATYDSANQQVILFSGYTASASTIALTNYTWSFHAGNWTNLSSSSALAPPGSTLGSFAYDAADGYAVLFGGLGNHGNSTPATWTFGSGGWVNRTDTVGTPPPNRGAMAFDASDGYLLYFGGFVVDPSLEIFAPALTWKFAGGTWANLTSSVAGSPPGRADGSIAYDPSVGAVLLFGGIYYTGPNWYLANDTWEYRGGNWTPVPSSLSPSGRENAPMAYDPSTGGEVLLGGWAGTLGQLSDTWQFVGGAWGLGGPILSAPVGTVMVNSTVTLRVTGTVFGTGAHFGYSGLPTGCLSVDRSSLDCRPTLNGSYLVTVRVSSGTLGNATASAHLQVGPVGSKGPPGTPGRAGIGAATEVALIAALFAAAGVGGAVWWQREHRANVAARRHLERLRAEGPTLLDEIGDGPPSGPR